MDASLVKIISLSFYIIGALAIASIIGVECMKSSKVTVWHSRLFNALLMAVFILYLLQIILAPLVQFSGSFGCNYIAPIIIGIHFPCRGLYFSIFIVRLYIIFQSSLYKYSINLLKTLFLVVITAAILLSFIYIYDHIWNAYYDGESDRCITSIPLYLMGITAVYDVSFNILTLYLFIKKLRLIISTVGIANIEEDDNIKLQDVITKSTVLVSVAIFTSFNIAAIYGVLLNNLGVDIITIDWIINSFCILLMKKEYHEYYEKYCFYPIKCVNKFCLKECDKNEANLSKSVSESAQSTESTESNNSETVSSTEGVTVQTVNIDIIYKKDDTHTTNT